MARAMPYHAEVTPSLSFLFPCLFHVLDAQHWLFMGLRRFKRGGRTVDFPLLVRMTLSERRAWDTIRAWWKLTLPDDATDAALLMYLGKRCAPHLRRVAREKYSELSPDELKALHRETSTSKRRAGPDKDDWLARVKAAPKRAVVEDERV